MSDDALILSMKSIIEFHAFRLAYINHCLSLKKDLEQCGWIGAIQAAKRFDGRCSFKSFAKFRIKGAMLDYLSSPACDPGVRFSVSKGRKGKPFQILYLGSFGDLVDKYES